MSRTNRAIALILGGGAGTRLFPLTRDRAKPAVPLAGKYRLIDVPISNCINSDVMHIFVLTQFNSASLNQHISRTYRFSSFSNGFVETIAAEQTLESKQWFQGTADAVRQVLQHIQNLGHDTVIVLSGDHLYRMDYRKFLARHYESEADVTVSVIPCTESEAQGFGLLKADKDGAITEFKEKPKDEELEAMKVDTTRFGLTSDEAEDRPYLASMGIYVFKHKRLAELLTEDQSWVDFGKEIIPASIENLNVQAHFFDKYWEDIGTIRAFYDANLDLVSPVPKFNFFNADAPIYTNSRYLPPSKIISCDIGNSMISEGCILNGVYARNSILGLRSRIDQGTRIENTIVMGADFYESFEEISEGEAKNIPHIGIGENSTISGAIIDKNARIGKDVELINKDKVTVADGDNYYIKEGLILVPKDAVIADGSII